MTSNLRHPGSSRTDPLGILRDGGNELCLVAWFDLDWRNDDVQATTLDLHRMGLRLAPACQLLRMKAVGAV
jgi:hypothetical protein